jgi:hypothetical protein
VPINNTPAPGIPASPPATIPSPSLATPAATSATTPPVVGAVDVLEAGGASNLKALSGPAAIKAAASLPPVRSPDVERGLSGGIRSVFPLDGLESIDTRGRWAQGFRLDGGTVRMMWLSTRRIDDAAQGKGFELFFQAHGSAVERFAERMTKAGAKTGQSFSFWSAQPDTTAGETHSSLKRDGQTWAPTGSCLALSGEGFVVEYVPKEPEALKGAFRIRVFGDPDSAEAKLADVVKTLGLQSVFAPPTKQTLERFKMFRFLWQVYPESLKQVAFTPVSALAAALASLDDAPALDANVRQAIDAEPLAGKEIKARLRLMTALYAKNPEAFLEWARSDASSRDGVFPAHGQPDPNAVLRTRLTQSGFDADHAKKVEAGGPPVKEDLGRALLELGALVRKSEPHARRAIDRDVETVKLSELEKIAIAAGATPERLAKLEFVEVYPGYFTVYDPSLPAQLAKAGARYMYSTADNADRVIDMLLGGQKSSLTRFQEGVLVQGKSSNSDFGSGGASSVFSRVVTESAQMNAIKKSGTYTFMDWGGSRPYKLVINRAALGRLDWYAYNGDNFGRTTTLKPENHGEAIIRTMNANYVSNNELMFPIGNSPRFVDFVVCSNDAQKKELVDKLNARGITEFNGRPIESFVRVESSFFVHPDDLDVALAVRTAVLVDQPAELAGVAKTASKDKVAALIAERAEWLEANVEAEVEALAPEKGSNALRYEARNEAGSLIAATPAWTETLGLAALEGSTLDAARAAIREAMAATLKGAAQSGVGVALNEVRSDLVGVATTALAAQDALQEAVLAELDAQFPGPAKLGYPARGEAKTVALERLKAVLRPALEAEAAGPRAEKIAARMEVYLREDLKNNTAYHWRYASDDRAKAVAAEVLDAAAGEAVVASLLGPLGKKLEPKAKTWMAEAATNDLRYELRQRIEPKLKEQTADAIAEAARAAIAAQFSALFAEKVAPRIDELAKTHPERATPEERARVPALLEEAFSELGRDLGAKSSTEAWNALLPDKLNAAIGAAVNAQADALTASVVGNAAREALRDALKTELTSRASAWAKTLDTDVEFAAVAEAVIPEVRADVLAAARAAVVNDAMNDWALSSKLSSWADAVVAKLDAQRT